MSNSYKIMHDHESQLMLKAADDNRKAFEHLYNKYYPILRQFLVKRNSHNLLLEDIVQKVFTRIWEQRKNFRAESSFQTYLFSVAKNMLSEEKKYFLKTNMELLRLDLITTNELADDKTNAHYLSMTRLLYEAVDNLPTKSAQAIKLHYFKNLSTSDAARIAGCSSETFQKRLYRAKNQLRDVLSPLESAERSSKK